MDAAAQSVFKERVLPLLNEVLDGFVLVGYHTTVEGKRERVVFFNDTRFNKMPDPMVIDAMSVPVQFARQWGAPTHLQVK